MFCYKQGTLKISVFNFLFMRYIRQGLQLVDLKNKLRINKVNVSISKELICIHYKRNNESLEDFE